MPDLARRRELVAEQMDAAGCDLMFLPPSADLEYLTGLRRRILTFGDIEYAHSYTAGWFFGRGHDPVLVLPRMMHEFDLPEGFDGATVVVRELDDGAAKFEQVARWFGSPSRVAVGPRTWADATIALSSALGGAELVSARPMINKLRRVKDAEELALMEQGCSIVDDVLAEVTPAVVAGVPEMELARYVDHLMRLRGSRTASFDTGVWSMGPASTRDATVRLSGGKVEPGMGVSFDFGAVVDGYCSDFGRTIHVGEPTARYLEVYEVVMAAQAAGIAAARAGVTAASVDAATRQVIVDAGYGEWFRHRTGHCIGLDVHEWPFISEEDETVLLPGMTFTIEPSVFWPGEVGVRVEDIVVCEEGGGRKLNRYSTAMVANA